MSEETNPPQQTEPETKEPESLKPFSLEILKLIKDAQQQHGLRHGDYQRYRGYCSRRIRRLRKVLKIPQGDRRHFKRKDVTEIHIANPKADERYLHIPLALTERCWAYAMQLRQEANTEPRKKFHLIQKLRKACVYALQLDELCKQERCDARTRLESQAYVAWIQGTLQFELKLWLAATENFKKAQVIYEKLISALSEEEQLPYKQRVEEIAPSLRYCAYNIGDEKAINVLELRSQGLLENFETLVSQTKEKAAVLHEIVWFGIKVPVKIERVRLFLLGIEGLDESLKNAEDNQAKIKILENLFIDLRDIISLARDNSKVDKQDILILAYLLSIRVERTSQRNLLLVQGTRRSQDCVRLLDINIQQTGELSQNEAIKEVKEAQNYYDKQLQAYKILRSYFLAKTAASQKRWKEATVLFDSSEQAMKSFSVDSSFIDELKELLKTVKETAEIETVSARANIVLDLQEDQKDNLLPQKAYKSKKPLIERLDEFREEPQLASKNPNVVNVPPNMEPVPVKPLFYDLALNFVQFPDLQEKLEGGQAKAKQGAGISGFVKGLWGWGKK